MKKFLLFCIALFCVSGLAISQNGFITTWETTTANEVIGIPTLGNGYNYDVDWENDNIYDDIGVTGNISHTYPNPGIHTVVIRGAFPRIHFRSFSSAFRAKILSVEQWGNIAWTSMEEAFFGCTNLEINALDSPDLSNVTNMYAAFLQVSNFNQPIDQWDVSNVTNMRFLFDQSGINQPINSWDVSSVTDMAGMFEGTSFNQPLDNWDMSAVTTLQVMFFNNFVFNQPIGNWDVSSVTDMSFMFLNTISNTTSFNQPIGNWDVSNVLDMQHMFEGATSFNQDIDSWNVSGVTNMSQMFIRAQSFNQSLNSWDVSSVINMSRMFEDAISFNKRIGAWNVSNVTDMSSMFKNATAFNQLINNWNVSSVTNMSNMFEGATSFNQTLDNWNVSSITNMQSMFNGATTFDQNLDNWDVSSVTNMSNMFLNGKLSIANYDATLIGWDALNLQPNVDFHAGTSQYCNAAAQRTNMINNDGWTITDGGQTICSLSIDEFDNNDFSLYPNPTNKSFSIESKYIINHISINDIQGKSVKTFKEPLTSYNIEELTSGLYFINIKTNEGQITKKLIKQ